MSEDAVISVEHVSKAYRIWENPAARLTSPLQQEAARLFPAGSPPRRWLEARAARRYRDFHALQDISFELRKGESLGIIGRNGSGKSTLLQIIAGTLQPTAGSARVTGRVAALLELGSGFNPDFTGRENVFLNGAVLGLSRAEVAERFDRIAAFADIGDFIDQPVKTYSSGMVVRLAFSVAVSVEPEILIVDEALSVGDVFFQQKCFRRVHEMLAGGVTLLFVSHDTTAVQNLCTRAILLSAGKAIFTGRPEETAVRYNASAQALPDVAGPLPPPSPPESRDLDLRHFAQTHNVLPSARNRHGARGLEILAAAIRDRHGLPCQAAAMGETLEFIYVVKAHQPVAEPQAALIVYDRLNNLVFAGGNHNVRHAVPAVGAGDTLVVSFELTFDVQPGPYTLSLIVSEESTEGPNHGVLYDVHEGIGPIVISHDVQTLMSFYGIAKLPLRFTHSARITSS